ncbi:hypothetical protein Poly59_14200 [Rubripirellula reticaptiva]|uniref:Uncharacterized protein n=1 Tax=Rubripirellula reticaptiva TaxID=2528013 RepID=A0A5C6F3G6_9BACT|nr:hypothetical protein Poly59_14200 [Rubripirellula reticaptiva]
MPRGTQNTPRLQEGSAAEGLPPNEVVESGNQDKKNQNSAGNPIAVPVS